MQEGGKEDNGEEKEVRLLKMSGTEEGAKTTQTVCIDTQSAPTETPPLSSDLVEKSDKELSRPQRSG